MNIASNRLAAAKTRNSFEFAKSETTSTRDDALNNSGHNQDGDSLEQDFNAHISYSQAEAGYWKHRKAVRDKLSRISYTGLPSLDPVHLQALATLVESYSEAVEETTTFSRDKAKVAAQQQIARAGMKVQPDQEDVYTMITGTGDAMDSASLKRRQVLLAESPGATPEILAELAMSTFSEVRETVIDHRLCPVSIHLMLAEDECADVRFALAENHNMSFHVLEKLSHDDNPYVATRAQRTMRRILFDNVVCMEVPTDGDIEGQVSATG